MTDLHTRIQKRIEAVRQAFPNGITDEQLDELAADLRAHLEPCTGLDLGDGQPVPHPHRAMLEEAARARRSVEYHEAAAAAARRRLVELAERLEVAV